MNLSYPGEIETTSEGHCPGCGKEILLGSKGQAIWLSEIGLKDSADRAWHKQCAKDALGKIEVE